MDCAGCGRTNRPGAKFCGGCGRPLAPRCPSCGTECQPGAQFCDACGASLAAAKAPAAEARKVVTIVFADLIGSTALHERLDAESARRLMDRYHRSMGAVVESHGGTVMQLLGDGVLAGFGVPRVAEDDALRAVRAAVGMQQAFRALAEEQAERAGQLGLRVAVYTGEVVAGDDHTHVMGDPVNVAARLQQEAGDGDVLLGESTRRLVADKVTLAAFGSFTLKGRAEPVAAWRVVSLERPAGAAAIAFVGREDELRRIQAVYDGAVATRAARLAVVLGSPGLGKSRLIDEFTRRLGDGATVLLAHCNAAGGATFAPLADAVRGILRIDTGAAGDVLRQAILEALPGEGPERDRIADGIAALVAGTPASPEEIFFVVRRGLATLAGERPVLLAIDDIQWAEPLLLDLVEHLVQWGSDTPLLVLVAARLELRDARSSLATPGGLVADVVTLSGLDAGAATRLAANAIGAAELPAAIAGRILATSEGNPLFVGELVRMLVQDGALRREGDRWTTAVELADLEIPPTIHALLAARIERLRSEERTVLERAAVIGRHFSRAALSQLLPREIGDLDARLESLRRSELVEPDTGWFLGEPALRFHHVLIRDAAYRRLLKNTRAELHGRFADWLEARAAGAVEHDETLGWHLEQAHQLLRELGPLDPQGRAFGDRAARHLAAAGRRALARDDLTPAASLLERALARLDPDDPTRAELSLDWCEAGLSAGDVSASTRAIAELARFIGGFERLRAWHTCFCGQLAVLTDPKALHASENAVAAAAAALDSAGDAAGEAKAHSVHALVLAQLGKIGACEAALDKALAAARRAGDRRRANAVLAGAPVAALWGPGPVTRASGRCLDVVRVLRITQGAPAVEAVALRCQAVLETLRGRAEAARRMIASSRKMVEELGITQRVLEADLFAGLIELLEGDSAAAERCLRVAYQGLRARGLGIDAAQAAALLGRALLAQGRVAEAEAISIESESLAGDSFKAAIAWRGVRAEALAARGEHAAAIDFARAAVEIAAATDDLLDHADARQALAVALRAASRSAEAGAEEKRAIELWEAKGATLLVERARNLETRNVESPRFSRPSSVPAQTTLHRVCPNAATAVMARSSAAIEARDTGAIAALHGEAAEYVDHTTGASYGREGFLASLRSLTSARDLTFRQEPLAVLGDSLVLARRISSASGVSGGAFDIGPLERIALNLFEVDEQLLTRRIETFSTDRLGDAIARLYERYAELLPEGPERIRASATARAVGGALGRLDPDRLAEAILPGVESVDHRILGTWSARDAEALLAHFRAVIELAADISLPVHEVLRLEPGALLVRRTHLGTDRASGGAYERPHLLLLVFGSGGLVSRWETFDEGQRAEALARFDELTAEPPPQFANAATRVMQRFVRCWRERDWDGMVATLAPAHRVDDRRRLVGTHMSAEQSMASLRFVFEQPSSQMHAELLATRGERLALFRIRISGHSSDSGPIEAEHLQITEIDENHGQSAIVIFDEGDFDAAYAELDERFAVGEAAPHASVFQAVQRLSRFISVRDWDQARSVLSEDFIMEDHRRLGWGTRSRDEFVTQVRALVELAPDARARIQHKLAVNSGGVLGVAGWVGSREGGPFEIANVSAILAGPDGRIKRWHAWDLDDLDDLDAARARFEELTREPASPVRIENAATRSEEAVGRAWKAGDWEALAALFPADSRRIDHRPLMRLETDRDTHLAGIRPIFDARVERAAELLATRGERLALYRLRLRGSVGASGPSEVELLQMIEVDASGLRKASIAFAPEDLDGAHAELDERFRSGEAAPHRATWDATRRFAQALDARDWRDALAALSEDFVFEDHRLVGFGSRSRDEFIDQMRAMVDLSPDVGQRVDHTLAVHDRGLLAIGGWVGTREGGVFEIPSAAVMEVGPDRRIRRIQNYDVDQLGAARARFAALMGAPQAHPIENAATRREDALRAAWEARDWESVTALFPPHFRSVDRRPLVRFETGRDELLAWVRPFFETGLERWAQLIATRGEGLAVYRVRLLGSDGLAGPSEVEFLQVIELDANGKCSAEISFGPEDLDAAYAELDARYAAGEAAPHARVAAGMQEFKRAFAERDWKALAARCAPDIIVHDRRLLGWETLHGPEAYVEALRQLVDLAPDTKLRIDHTDISAAGYLVITVWEGSHHGGAYEAPSLMVAELDGEGRIRRFDQYDLERLEEARARFAELRPDPLRIPPNAATRAMDRAAERIEAGDWQGLTDLFSPSFRFEDRRRLFRDSGDRDKLVASIRLAASHGFRTLVAALATVGERLALLHLRFQKFEDGALIAEVENLQLFEVDPEGRFVASTVFDADDRRAASMEMTDRYLGAQGSSGVPPSAAQAMDALNSHDLARLRAALPDDFYLDDHRRTGLGRIEGADAYVASVRVFLEQTRDLTTDILYHIAAGRSGSLSVARMFGTLADGGAFENVLVRLGVFRGDRIAGVEVFELEDLELARARFEALGR